MILIFKCNMTWQIYQLFFFYKLICIIILLLVSIHLWYNLLFKNKNKNLSENPLFQFFEKCKTFSTALLKTKYKRTALIVCLTFTTISIYLYWKFLLIIISCLGCAITVSVFRTVYFLYFDKNNQKLPTKKYSFITLTKKTKLSTLLTQLFFLAFHSLSLNTPLLFFFLKKKTHLTTYQFLALPTFFGFLIVFGTPIWLIRCFLSLWTWVLQNSSFKSFCNSPSKRKVSYLYKLIKEDAAIKLDKLIALKQEKYHELVQVVKNLNK